MYTFKQAKKSYVLYYFFNSLKFTFKKSFYIKLFLLYINNLSLSFLKLTFLIRVYIVIYITCFDLKKTNKEISTNSLEKIKINLYKKVLKK